MTNKTLEQEMGLKKDILRSVPTAVMGGIVGFIRSFLDPKTIPNNIGDIRNNGIKTFNDFTGYIGNFGGYVLGVVSIVDYIVQNPENPLSYIPVATNLISGIGQLSYRRGKKSD